MYVFLFRKGECLEKDISVFLDLGSLACPVSDTPGFGEVNSKISNISLSQPFQSKEAGGVSHMKAVPLWNIALHGSTIPSVNLKLVSAQESTMTGGRSASSKMFRKLSIGDLVRESSRSVGRREMK